MKLPKLIIFDLDGTLAVSKSPITQEMWLLLADLLSKTEVAIITWGRYLQFEKQVFPFLPENTNYSRLSIFPTSWSSYYAYNGSDWQKIYAHNLSSYQVSEIIEALKISQEKAGIITEKPFWWEQIENRETQISWSALGQETPPEIKKTWDTDQRKRLAMLPYLEKLLPDFSVHLGGMTTIDITQKWVDKKYGIEKMREYLHIEFGDMFFIGDAIFPGGNDYAPVEMGIAYKKTDWPIMTMWIISELLI